MTRQALIKLQIAERLQCVDNRSCESKTVGPMFTTRQSSNQEILDYIGLFRSQEYIKAIAKQRLKVPLQEHTVANIVASFAQGLAYLSSADTAVRSILRGIAESLM